MNKLVHVQFPNTGISKQVLHWRTKCETLKKVLVKKVFGPKSLNDMLGDLKEVYNQQPAYFGICWFCSDASNKRKRKLFQTVLKYFPQWEKNCTDGIPCGSKQKRGISYHLTLTPATGVISTLGGILQHLT